MGDHVYQSLEVTGSSKISMEEAIQNAIAKLAKSVRDLRWFEVIETRGLIESEKVSYWQVTVKVGFDVHEGLQGMLA